MPATLPPASCLTVSAARSLIPAEQACMLQSLDLAAVHGRSLPACPLPASGDVCVRTFVCRALSGGCTSDSGSR
jgi:hypothetical protein